MADLMQYPGSRPGELTHYIRDDRGTMAKVPRPMVRHVVELSRTSYRHGLVARPWYFSVFTRIRNFVSRKPRSRAGYASA